MGTRVDHRRVEFDLYSGDEVLEASPHHRRRSEVSLSLDHILESMSVFKWFETDGLIS